MLNTDLREELEDVVLEHNLLQNKEQDSPPAEQEVTQEQHVGHNTEPINQMVELISQGAVLIKDSQMVMEEHVVYKEIAESAEQRPADESRNDGDRSLVITFNPLILQPSVENQREIKEAGLKFLREPPVWSERETGIDNCSLNPTGSSHLGN